jgi:hypothetical protein
MDTLAFIVEMTKALAWPIAAGAIAITYRTQIKDLLARMRKGKLGPAEFEFETRLKELAAENPDATSPGPSKETLAAKRIQAEPRAVVLEQWLFVEEELRKRALAEGLSEAKDMPAHVLLGKLESMKRLNPLAGPLFRDLRSLRNSAAHSSEFEPDPEAVTIYVNMSKKLCELIRGT